MTTACGTHDPAGSVSVRDSTEEAAAAAHSLWVVLFGPAHGQSGTARGLSSCGWGALSLPARPQRVSMSRMRRSRLFTSRAVIRVHGPTLDYGVVNGTVPQTWCGPARVRPLIGPRRTRAAVGIKCTPVCSRAAAERGAVDTCAPHGEGGAVGDCGWAACGVGGHRTTTN